MENTNIQSEECFSVLEKLTVLFEAELSNDAVKKLIGENPSCEKIILDQIATWEKLKVIDVPEPSVTMDVNFYRALNQIDISTDNIEAPSFGTTKQMLARITVAASLFIAGLVMGKYFTSQPQTNNLVALEAEMAPQDYLTYTNNKTAKVSATDKLNALQEIKANSDPSEKVLDALFQALLNDPNTNVRLSAIETLVYFADKPEVREFLIKAIPHQDSPLVQIALADATSILQEKGAAEAWKQLLSSDEVEPDVKMHLQKTLKTIL